MYAILPQEKTNPPPQPIPPCNGDFDRPGQL